MPPVIINDPIVIPEPSGRDEPVIRQEPRINTTGIKSDYHPGSDPLQRWYGVYPALVNDVRDPEGQGRVQIRLPWVEESGGNYYEAWARLATLMAGTGRGSWFIPEIGDEVLVSFEAGDPGRPYVIGALWNGVDSPPEIMDSSGHNNHKLVRTRSGLQILLDDSSGQEKIILSTPGGRKLQIQDSPDKVMIDDGNGSRIVLESSGIKVVSGGKVAVDASQVEINAGIVSVNAGMTNFSGVVKADTMITNTVIASTYTPGSGNIW